MPRFLILRLDGPMQAWGTHTFEDFRPSNLYPTRSGLLGLLAVCLGIARSDHTAQARLAASVEFSVRVDGAVERPGREKEKPFAKRGVKLPDFHTVMNARKVDGSVNKFPVVSRREYPHITREDILAALAFAAEMMQEEQYIARHKAVA